MKTKAPETARPSAHVASVHAVSPLHPPGVAPGQPHAVTLETVPAAPFNRPEDEADAPHWIDPVTGFPDTQRRRDGSLFSIPKA